jgi:hypothetical protein
MNPHPLAPSPNLPRLFLPAYWLSGEGGEVLRGRGSAAPPSPSSTNPSPHARSGGKKITARGGGRGGGGGQKASLRSAGATPGWSLKGPTLGAGQLAEGRWDLILWKPLPPETEHTRTFGGVEIMGRIVYNI